MSQAIVLRTLARASVLDFGRHKDRTVQQLLDLKHYRAIRWYYYNCSMISFLPDILEEVGITEEWRIQKPGKNPEKGAELDRQKDVNTAKFRKAVYMDSDLPEMGKISKQKAKQRKRDKAEYARFKERDRRQFSKGSMAWKNQGH